MVRKHAWTLVVLALTAVAGSAEEVVTVVGTNYPATIQQKVGSKTVQQVLTGTAVRKKLFINVYTIASYVDANVKVRSAEQLASVDALKQLHIVMKRDLTGKQLADAFVEAVRLNYAAPAFEQELKALSDQLRAIATVPEGHSIRLTHVPGVGFHGNLGGTNEVLIKNPAFSQAVWEIYVGPRNLGNTIKVGLTSRIK